MKMADFDYDLPDERIAYTPAGNRSDSKLLVWDQAIIAEAQYKDIADYIPTSHSLFFNNSKVIAARILFDKPMGLVDSDSKPEMHATANNRQNKIEIFCLEPTAGFTPVMLAMQATNKVTWKCLVGGAKKWKTEFLQKVLFYDHIKIILSAKKIAQEEGHFVIEFSWDHPNIVFSEIIALVGQIPLPPYIQREANETDKDRYQTTYATTEGSVAAPTAGLHFDEHVFKALAAKGIDKKFITLHVGAGTFMPVKVDDFQDHLMHAEFIDVDLQTIEYLATTSNNVIAVGTTSLRTLESLYWLAIKIKQTPEIDVNEINLLQWDAYTLEDKQTSINESMQFLKDWMNQKKLTTLFATTQLMVKPGYQFKICKGLITNFHQPKSTLLLIIAAIAGDEWKTVYQHAIANEYRFLSYGDGCLFWFNQR
ncbi:MAG: S-adenosylmethionine:tRNA ribosyltransferase-isomerase [Chitinophagia bacterium]|nr:S-adenosylmethionine:tRNA ribosyltransferase-isomerase [Chitinophagia bacterium]